MTKKSSFLRQLNLYCFNRLCAGPDRGSYYHEKFLRGMKFLCRRMTRQKVNGNRIRSCGNPDEEPKLALFPVCPPPGLASSSASPSADKTVCLPAATKREHAIYSALAGIAASAKSAATLPPEKRMAQQMSRMEDLVEKAKRKLRDDDGRDGDGEDNDDGDYGSSEENYSSENGPIPAVAATVEARAWCVP